MAERSHAMRDDAEWQRRYHTAEAVLDDASRMVRLHDTAAGVHPQGQPEARIVCGEALMWGARRVGLFAGSFNPLTQAHIALVEAARSQAQLDLMVWSLAAVTIDKERVDRATLPDRLAELSAYVEQRPQNALALFSRGLYVDQAEALRRHLASTSDVLLVVGFDKVVQIFDPRYYADRDAALDALFGVARLLVSPRAGEGADELAELLARPENQAYVTFVDFVALPPAYAADSSTEARAALDQQHPANGGPLERIVTPEGLALAATGAYAVTVDEASDRYLWRQHWLDALQRLPDHVVRRAPGLSILVSETLANTEAGRRTQRLLRQNYRDESQHADELATLFRWLRE